MIPKFLPAMLSHNRLSGGSNPSRPTKKTQLRYFVAKWHSCDSLFSVQFTAQLIAYRLPAFFALLHKCHVLRGYINITVVAFFDGCVLIAEAPKNQRTAILSAFRIQKTRRRLLTTTKRVCVIWKTISGRTNCFSFFCADKFKIALDLTNYAW
ncbi:MAG: hypothetical protein KH014_11365 [Subdoligranulum variabile]|nr:hypothetical protein [Subdoligranulum variabile]